MLQYKHMSINNILKTFSSKSLHYNQSVSGCFNNLNYFYNIFMYNIQYVWFIQKWTVIMIFLNIQYFNGYRFRFVNGTYNSAVTTASQYIGTLEIAAISQRLITIWCIEIDYISLTCNLFFGRPSSRMEKLIKSAELHSHEFMINNYEIHALHFMLL